jgi:hypothetical protein
MAGWALGAVHPAFVPTFKPGLSDEPLCPLARVGRESFTARDAAYAFLRELLRAVQRTTGQRVRDLVVTSPVDSFEIYRAEAQQRPSTLHIDCIDPSGESAGT